MKGKICGGDNRPARHDHEGADAGPERDRADAHLSAGVAECVVLVRNATVVAAHRLVAPDGIFWVPALVVRTCRMARRRTLGVRIFGVIVIDLPGARALRALAPRAI